jgi:hypothetical protein
MISTARRVEMSYGLAVLMLLAGCDSPADKIEQAELVTVGPGAFEYHVATDLFYPPDADTDAEAHRLHWLASDLAYAKICPADYDVLSRQVIFQYQSPLGYPVDEIIYRGHCRG